MDRVLVLNSDYTPINVTNIYRGFNLVNNGKAEILKAGETPIYSGFRIFPRPLIIRLLNYVKYRFKQIKINRQILFNRDKNQCVYCGSKKNLTIDHVIPKSRGGLNTWTNLATCCTKCNALKGDKTPEEANMKLSHKLFEPYVFSNIIHADIERVWVEFQISFL